MSWKPFVHHVDMASIPVLARATCAREEAAGRLVSVCAACQASTPALRAAVAGFKNLSHGYCPSHFAAMMREIDALKRPQEREAA